jgi:hypothetical protein
MFSPLELKDHQGTVSLNGQFRRGYYYAMLPSRLGKCKYTITVHTGKLRLNHMGYNPDGGSWTWFPEKRQPPHYNLLEGKSYEIDLVINPLTRRKKLIL